MNAFDKDLNTAWVEGVDGPGVGEWLAIKFDKELEIEGLVLVPGYVKSANVFEGNATPREIRLEIDNKTVGVYTLTYDLNFVEGQERDMGCYHTNHDINLNSKRILLFDQPIRGNSITLAFDEVLSGSRYTDLAITEWELILSTVEPALVDISILNVLRTIRDDESLTPFLSPSVSIEDLRTKFLDIDPTEKWIYSNEDIERFSLEDIYNGVEGTEKTTHFARVEDSGPGKSDSVFDKFLKHTKGALINSPITLVNDGAVKKIIGAISVSYGDGGMA